VKGYIPRRPKDRGKITLSRFTNYRLPYWPVYHPETPILARDAVEGQYESRDDNQDNMEMPMYQTIYCILPTSGNETPILA
jgi:hypothetical protein